MREKNKILRIINELIQKGAHISDEYSRGNDEDLAGDDHAFILSSTNLIETIFGKDHLLAASLHDTIVERSMEYIDYCIGTLEAAKHAIENDYMQKQELAIAGSVFDSTLVQAKELLEKKYKDPAAILGRVIVEDALRRLANSNDIAIVNDKGDNKKASILNDELKKKEIYGQVQWRRVQTWLDIGNEAAHGNFDKVREKDVESLLKDVELFIEEYFGDNG
jgi:hypothetical protein